MNETSTENIEIIIDQYFDADDFATVDIKSLAIAELGKVKKEIADLYRSIEWLESTAANHGVWCPANAQLSVLVADNERLRKIAGELAKHGNTYRMASSTDKEDWLELGEKFEDAINDFYEYEATGKIT